MIYFKGCAKCQGDMILDEDLYGSFYKCLQCGRQVDVEVQELGFSKETAREAAELAAGAGLSVVMDTCIMVTHKSMKMGM